MSLAALDIQISADIAELQKNLAKGESTVKDFENVMLSSTNGLKKFEAAIKKSTDPKEIKNLGDAATQLKAKIEALNASQNNLLGTQSKSVVGANQATNALTNLGRVAQDSAFGFVGIANNLNPLLESFQRLRVETGSAKGAFQALGSSLVGGGGLGLALSVVTAAISFASVGLTYWSKGNKEAKEKVDEHKKAIDGVYSSVASESTKVSTLVALLQSETATRERKTTAIKELQRIQPEVFNGLKLEGNLVAGLDVAYKNYLGNLRTVIAVRIKQLELEKVTEDILKKQGVTLTTVEKAQRDAGQQILKGTIKRLEKEGKVEEAAKLSIKLGDAQAKQAGEINVLFERQKDILKEIGDLQKGIDLSNTKTTASKITPDKKTFEQELNDELDFIAALFAKRVINFDEFIKRNNDAYNKAIEAAIKIKAPDSLVTKLQSSLIVLPKISVGNEPINITQSIKPDFEVSPDKIKALQAKMAQFLKTTLTPLPTTVDETSKAISGIIANTYANAFSGIGESIAASLVSGGNMFEGIFNGILNTFGEGLQQVGKQIIIGSKLLVGITESLKAGKFTGTLLGGIALVALGGVLKSIKIGQNAQGTDYWKGGLSLVGERGPEIVNLPRGAKVTPNHELGSIGGGMDIQIQPVTVFRGTELLVYFNRVSQLNNRI